MSEYSREFSNFPSEKITKHNFKNVDDTIASIINQINLSGNMDSKEGLEFSTRFPKMYMDYLYRFKEKKLKLYESYAFEENSIKVVNMLCYESFAFPTNLESIEHSLKYFV